MPSNARSDARAVAAQLLDAQVEYVLAHLTGEQLTQVIARDVDDLLALAAQLTPHDIADPADVKAAGHVLLDTVAGSPMVDDLAAALPDALYDLAASDEYRLDDVVAREPVSALIDKLLGMRQLQDRLLDRLTESPLVAGIASQFVMKIVADVVAQNRARAEKLPGVSSLLSLGTSAASRVRSATVDQFLGDVTDKAVDKGAQYALRRTNNTVRELLADAPVHAAAMQVWDLHAAEPVGALRAYVSQADLRELVALVHDVVRSAKDSPYARQAFDATVDVFFDRYGDRDVATLLDELGIERDQLVAELQRLVPPLVEAARANGWLAEQVRARLAPFFASDAVTQILRS